MKQTPSPLVAAAEVGVWELFLSKSFKSMGGGGYLYKVQLCAAVKLAGF